MAQTIYGLCTLTSLACAWMLLSSYRRNRVRLLFWSGLCFIGLSVNNVLLVLDKLVFPQVDLLQWRLACALVALLLLLFGLIYENK
ncbi:DUF5985 family protein [Duganella vulcania]|uniref:Uncharacterized protein n=1 Tax=Duganella vulcania TaxID=2692166 RepID=A0A845GIP1_9BURK|nr:DUF5985 family protein [Duganella vulcania]MCU6500961.1 DUF5985 family protein [Rugamonas sp. A1-17]MYM93302.1 hypothetical protein [Duganella vulcania]